MEGVRKKRLESELQKFISGIFSYKLRDKRLHWVTINTVELTQDLQYAKIYYTFFEDEISHEKMNKILTKSSGAIKKEIASAKILRTIPQLIFKYDETEDNAEKLEMLFEKIKEEKIAP